MTKKPKKAAVEAFKPKKSRQPLTTNPVNSSIYAALGVFRSHTHDSPIKSTAAPSAEWLTEMLMRRVESADESVRELWNSQAFDRDEILLHEAAIILDDYRMALMAIEIATGKLNDPLRLEELFTKEQLESGVEFGSKRKPGWPEIVTGYDTRDLALKALKDWADWEQSPGPEWFRRSPRKMCEVPGAGFVDSANGEEWLKWTCKLLDGWKDCRDVFLMRRHYLQYEELLRHEKEAKDPWEKRREKVLVGCSGENLAKAGKKVAQPGKSAQSKPAVRRRKKSN
jgi:hypothetical protein